MHKYIDVTDDDSAEAADWPDLKVGDKLRWVKGSSYYPEVWTVTGAFLDDPKSRIEFYRTMESLKEAAPEPGVLTLRLNSLSARLDRIERYFKRFFGHGVFGGEENE